MAQPSQLPTGGFSWDQPSRTEAYTGPTADSHSHTSQGTMCHNAHSDPPPWKTSTQKSPLPPAEDS